MAIGMKPTRSGADVVDILAHCELFSSLSRDACESIVERCQVRDLAPDTVIFTEGELGAEMYVLLEGELEAYKGRGDDRVVLKHMSEPGDHTGEGALVEAGGVQRRASVRTLTDCRVLAIPGEVFLDAVAMSPAIGHHMDAMHHHQAKQLSLLEKSVMYRALVLFDQEQDWSREQHFEPGEQIFAAGEPGDSVYVVRSGEVHIKRVEDGEEITLSVLREGQTFGELAVLEGRDRSASAFAVTATELVIVDREQFLLASSASPELHEYLGTLKKVYAMQEGVATLFDGEFRGDPAVVTVVKLDSGREVIVNHVIDKDIYSASQELPDDAEVEEYNYRDDNRDILRSLVIHQGRLVLVHAEGPWREQGHVHRLLLEEACPEPSALESFVKTGQLIDRDDLQLATSPDAVLCHCLGLTRAAIESVLAHGARTLEELADLTGATTICGGCASNLATMVGSTGQAVALNGQFEVFPGVRTFQFAPLAEVGANGSAEPEMLRAALPGQHVVLSAEVDGAWVHRPYTITSPPDWTAYREITVKREDHGFLSNLLFRQPEQLKLKLSHPKGDFWIDPKIPEKVVCLVAGIGMTPALAIARSLGQANSGLQVHVDYSARTEHDHAYRKELDALAVAHPTFTVNYRCTGGREYLNGANVGEIARRFHGARFLICGPEPYQHDVEQYLLEAGVKSDRIQIERFTPAGHAPQASKESRTISNRLELFATIGFCAAYLVMAVTDATIPGLSRWQSYEAYSIATGLLLLAFVSYQWYLPYLRVRGKFAQTGPPYRWHRYLGATAPVLLILHSASLGYAYTVLLPLLFVSNAVVGSLDKTLIADARKRLRFQRVWLSIHIPLSCVITFMMVTHMIYALAYQ